MGACPRHRGEELELDVEGRSFCASCLADEVEAQLARGEDPNADADEAYFGIPAKPETLRQVRRAPSKAVVLTFRLDEASDAELRQVAHRKGIGPSTLARMWLMESLERERKAR